MKKFVIAALIITFSSPAQFVGALEERHPERRGVHSELNDHFLTERSSSSKPAESDSHGTATNLESSGKVGPNQAVLAADPNLGIKLSDLSAKTMGLAFVPVHQTGEVLVPRESIVRSEDEVGVYRSRDGWLKLIAGQISSEGDKQRFTATKSSDLRSGDQVATGGVPLIRITDIYIFSAEEGEGE